MASFDEIAEEYAEKIRQAVRSDGFTKTASLTESRLRGSATARAFKAIEKDLDRYTVGGRPLTEDQRRAILDKAGEELDITDADDFYRSTKSASNDAYMQMITFVGDIIKKTAK